MVKRGKKAGDLFRVSTTHDVLKGLVSFSITSFFLPLAVCFTNPNA